MELASDYKTERNWVPG
jgi:hypothetical protein